MDVTFLLVYRIVVDILMSEIDSTEQHVLVR